MPLHLAQTPTPLHLLPRLSQALGVELWIKRDDLTGLGLSGNKVRKLEFLLQEAQALGADTLITTGGLQSNHARATAVAARQLGMRPVLLLRGEPPEALHGNLLLDQLLGAELHYCSPEDYAQRRDELMEELAETLRAQGGTPYIIPEGGSNGLGSMGFVAASAEVHRQIQEPFQAVVCAVGSGGTLAGLAMAPTPIGRVLGVAVCDDRQTFVDRARTINDQALALGMTPLAPPGPGWEVLEAYRGPAYAVATPEIWQTIAWVARAEGILLDPVYTGKAMHGLIQEVKAGRLKGRLLFWHTGGAFGLFGRGAELPR